MKINPNKVYSFSFTETKSSIENGGRFTELFNTGIKNKNTESIMENVQEKTTGIISSPHSQYGKKENSGEKVIFPGKIIDRRI